MMAVQTDTCITGQRIRYQTMLRRYSSIACRADMPEDQSGRPAIHAALPCRNGRLMRRLHIARSSVRPLLVLNTLFPRSRIHKSLSNGSAMPCGTAQIAICINQTQQERRIYKMFDDFANYEVSPEVVKAGLMVVTDGAPHITDAGLFAITGASMNSPDAESRKWAMTALLRVMRVAELPRDAEDMILGAFLQGVNPGDGSELGISLAAICRRVASKVGMGRMAKIIDQTPPHSKARTG